MSGVLLDTHALYWYVRGEAMSGNAKSAIVDSQAAGNLFVSPISAWELAIATGKPRVAGRPHLGDSAVDQWFRTAVQAISARVVTINPRIACEAAKVVVDTGHKDPGDCFLMATARVRKLAIITRDGVMIRIAKTDGDYLRVIAA